MLPADATVSYTFRDSSVPPPYHRSYVITFNRDRARIVVDRYGAARVLAGGLLLLAVSFTGVAMAPSYAWLLPLMALFAIPYAFLAARRIEGLRTSPLLAWTVTLAAAAKLPASATARKWDRWRSSIREYQPQVVDIDN